MTLHRGHDSTTGQCRVILWFCSTFQHRPGLKIPNQTFLRSSQAVIQRKYLWNFLESPHKMLMFLRRFKANLKGVRQIIGNRACSFFAVFLITPCNVLCTVYTVNHLLFIKKTKQKTNKNTPKSKQIADNQFMREKKDIPKKQNRQHQKPWDDSCQTHHFFLSCSWSCFTTSLSSYKQLLYLLCISQRGTALCWQNVLRMHTGCFDCILLSLS